MLEDTNLPEQLQLYKHQLDESGFKQPYSSSYYFSSETDSQGTEVQFYIFSKNYNPCPTVELSSVISKDALNPALDKYPKFTHQGIIYTKIDLLWGYYYYTHIGISNRATRGTLPGWIVLKFLSEDEMSSFDSSSAKYQDHVYAFGAEGLDYVMLEKPVETSNGEFKSGVSYKVSGVG
jgi:hypothetical protein